MMSKRNSLETAIQKNVNMNLQWMGLPNLLAKNNHRWVDMPLRLIYHKCEAKTQTETEKNFQTIM